MIKLIKGNIRVMGASALDNIRLKIRIAKFKTKLSGINLIGLIVASGLGVFILGAIIKISLTISTNIQLIKAISELESSARNLEKFFTKIISANGYNNVGASRGTNDFSISSKGDIQFSLWFSGGISNAVTCSGQPLYSTSPVPVIIYMKLPDPTAPIENDKLGYITCADNPSIRTPWSANSLAGQTNMPLVSRAQIADFYVVLSSRNQTAAGLTMQDIPLIKNTNAQITTFDPFALKVIILLRSSVPIFAKRSVNFNLFPGKTFSSTDGYLYKLLVIHAPFENTTASGTQATISF